MPLLMKLGMGLAALFALGAATLILLAQFGIGLFEIDGQPVSANEWLRVSAPLFLIAGGLMAGIAYGFCTRKTWARRLVMALWFAVGSYGLLTGVTGAVPISVMWRAIIQAIVLGSVASWYFYRKRNVVEYFNAIANLKSEI
ncbi:MAG: hypothetical protein ABI874_07990 [Chloroflexota bacterium]